MQVEKIVKSHHPSRGGTGHFRVKEAVFWRNYFYRVSLIKQSAQLTALAAQQQAAEKVEEDKGSDGPEDTHLTGRYNNDSLYSSGVVLHSLLPSNIYRWHTN